MSKLLLVEDDNNLREIYEARLQAEGYTIVSAQDGEEALAVAKAEKPDLIISDVMMPKISGFEMLDIIRNTDGLKTVKIIMLTALGQNDDQQKGEKLGADRYLVKSQVTLEDIVKVAHELLEDQPAETTSPTPEASPATLPTAPSATSPAPAEPPVASQTIPVATPPVADPQPEPVSPTPTDTPEPPVVPAPEPTPEPVASQTMPVATPPVTEPQPEPATSEAQSESDESASMENEIANIVSGATTEATAPQSDQSVSSAVNALSTSSTALDTPSSQESPEGPTASSEVPTIVETPPSNNQANSSANVANKKVISPPNSQPTKPDIQALYAAEQAKEATGAQQVDETQKPSGPDPSSIAL